MSATYYDQSYPPSLMQLPASHDLQLVGTVTPGTLEVSYAWNAGGRATLIDFGDGQSTTATVSPVVHTYATGDEYTVTASSPQTSDSAVIDLSSADPPQAPEPEEDTPEAPQGPEDDPEAPEAPQDPQKTTK